MERLDKAKPHEIAEWDATDIAAAWGEIVYQERLIRDRKARLRAGLAIRYASNGNPGTTHRIDGEYAVKITTGKKVEWDQSQLAALATEIGETATDYMDITYSVSESKYKAWPAVIRERFEPARTVKPGTVNYEFRAKKEEAA